MFKRRWKRAILKNGAAGSGTVVRAQRDEIGKMIGPGLRQTLKLRRVVTVSFPDGDRDFTASITPRDIGAIAGARTAECWDAISHRTRVGQPVPVRYDERDHSRIALDLPALVRELLGWT
jgi:hypothetical protein